MQRKQLQKKNAIKLAADSSVNRKVSIKGIKSGAGPK